MQIQADDARVLAALEQLVRTTPQYSTGVVSLPFGAVQYVDPVSLRIQYDEVFVQHLYDFETASTKPRIVDCGGNIGLTVVRFKQLYPHANVTVFEADPTICLALATNVDSLALPDVRVVCAAAWVRDGQMEFVVEGGEGGRLAEKGDIRVETVRLADTITQRVDLLKLDIEGAEWDVLADLCDSGALRLVDKLICEFHGRRGNREALGSLLSKVSSLGFNFTFPWSFCEPGLAGESDPTPFRFAADGKFISFLYAWQPTS